MMNLSHKSWRINWKKLLLEPKCNYVILCIILFKNLLFAFFSQNRLIILFEFFYILQSFCYSSIRSTVTVSFPTLTDNWSFTALKIFCILGFSPENYFKMKNLSGYKFKFSINTFAVLINSVKVCFHFKVIKMKINSKSISVSESLRVLLTQNKLILYVKIFEIIILINI